MRPDELAAAVVSEMRSALAPVREQLAALEKSIAVLGPETAATVARELAGVRERVAALETRPPVAGPPGEPGAPGKDGEPGAPGVAGLEYRDVYQAGHTYERGHVVTYSGSAWHCNESTDRRPGDGSAAWTLMVKRGADGKGRA